MLVGYILSRVCLKVVSSLECISYFFTISGFVCVKLAYASLGGREDIPIIHLVIIIKSEVSTFPIVFIFLSVVMCLRWLYHQMLSASYLSLESWVLFLLLPCSFMMCANNRIYYDPMVVFVWLHFTLPHFHHYTYVSESIALLKYLSGTLC